MEKKRQFTVYKRIEADNSMTPYYEWGRKQYVIDTVQREIKGFKNGTIRADSDVSEAAIYETGGRQERVAYWKKKKPGT